jgi:hypothetical protein
VQIAEADTPYVRRLAVTVSLATLLVVGSGAGWLVWAENEYRGLDACPWSTRGTGRPALVALGFVLVSAVMMAWPRWRDNRKAAVSVGIVTGLLAGLVIAIVALFFGAGLRCND